jgi:hypothetical protein
LPDRIKLRHKTLKNRKDMTLLPCFFFMNFRVHSSQAGILLMVHTDFLLSLMRMGLFPGESCCAQHGKREKYRPCVSSVNKKRADTNPPFFAFGMLR